MNSVNSVKNETQIELNRVFQILRPLLLAAAILLSAAMLKQYIHEQLFLWPAREEGAGFHLLLEPRFRVFRLSPADGGNISWWFSSTGDPPEGSTGILSIPSWPLALGAIGILIGATFLIFDPETWGVKKISE